MTSKYLGYFTESGLRDILLAAGFDKERVERILLKLKEGEEKPE